VTANPAPQPLANPRTLYTACPLCDGPEIPFLREADCTRHPLYSPQLPPTVRWHRCTKCQHVFTDGYFTTAATDILFGRTNANQEVGHDIERQRFVSARMVERVARHARPGRDWLDVGAGNGSLIFTADEFGYKATALDLRRDTVTALQRLGFEAHSVSIEDFDAPERFAVVSMADVLEHMPFPKIGLAAAHRLLQPDAILLISMPNMGCALWRMLDAQNANPYWGEIEHYHNFSRQRLYELLQECGFTPHAYAVSERYRACMEIIAVRD
jgi:protein O-GlcNAc transferase